MLIYSGKTITQEGGPSTEIVNTELSIPADRLCWLLSSNFNYHFNQRPTLIEFPRTDDDLVNSIARVLHAECRMKEATYFFKVGDSLRNASSH